LDVGHKFLFLKIPTDVSMDQLLVHLIRPPEKVNYGLINEAMMKIEYCSKLLDQLENNEKVMPNQEEDLVTKLKVWLMESETFSIKVILHLVVELSLKENIYAELFIKHEFFLILVGLIDVKLGLDNEMSTLCCLILHNLLARGCPPTEIVPDLLSLLSNLSKITSSDPMLKVLAMQAIGMIDTYNPSADICGLVSDFCINFKWDFAVDPGFSVSPQDLIRLLDSHVSELNHLGLWLLAHGEANALFDWKFVALQLESMSCLDWENQKTHGPYFHFYHLAISNVNNATPGIWNKIFNSPTIKVRRRCDCLKLTARGFADQFIIAEKPKPIEDIENRIFGHYPPLHNNNNTNEDHSTSETTASAEER
jgi:hypothetical protein